MSRRTAVNGGNGRGARTAARPFEPCASRFAALEQQTAQVASTLGLLLQEQEKASGLLAQLTRGQATLERGMALMCQAHGVEPAPGAGGVEG